MTEPLNNGGEKVQRPILRDPVTNRLLKGTAPLNPAGKPKGSKHLSTLLWKALLQKAKDKHGNETDKTNADLVIARLIHDNITKGARTELIFDRIEGQAKQEIDFTTNGESITASDIDVQAIAEKVSAELKARKTKQ